MLPFLLLHLARPPPSVQLAFRVKPGIPPDQVTSYIYLLLSSDGYIVRELDCTRATCSISMSVKDATEFCEAVVSRELLCEWENVLGTRLELSGCETRPPTPCPCVKECVMKVRNAFGRWNNLDPWCKDKLLHANREWNEDRMGVLRTKAEGLCKDCSSACDCDDHILFQLQDDLDRAEEEHCRPKNVTQAEAFDDEWRRARRAAKRRSVSPRNVTYAEAFDDEWRRARRAARRRSIVRPPASHDVKAWPAAALIALLLSATSIGCQLCAVRPAARRLTPFALRIGRRPTTALCPPR